MTISVAVNTRNVEVNAATALANSGSIVFYSGTMPATADTALSGNSVLGTVALPGTAFAAAASGSATANAITSVTASATGTCTFYRMFKSDTTTVIMQGDVGTSGTAAVVNSTSFVSGAPVTISSMTYARP